MSLNLDFWKPIIGESWYNNNEPLFNSTFMENVLTQVNMEYKRGTVFPLQKDIFKALKLTPFDKVRVVILGREPYTTENGGEPYATGLAFANNVDVHKPSIELNNIHRAVERGCYDGLKVDFDITLEEWANQGVLLLNTSLTVNKHKPGSHSPIWEAVTKYIVQSLDKQKTGIHFVFWGDYVKKYADLVNGLFHFKYIYGHPSEKMKINHDWKCTHFNEINMNLIQTNGYDEVIAW